MKNLYLFSPFIAKPLTLYLKFEPLINSCYLNLSYLKSCHFYLVIFTSNLSLLMNCFFPLHYLIFYPSSCTLKLLTSDKQVLLYLLPLHTITVFTTEEELFVTVTSKPYLLRTNFDLPCPLINQFSFLLLRLRNRCDKEQHHAIHLLELAK